MRLLRHLPRFRAAYRAMDALLERESWPRSQIEAFQLERLNTLWQGAIVRVPFYREMAARCRLPPRFSSLGEFSAAVPMVSKVDVQKGPERFLSQQPARGSWRRTGGSTGAPVNVFWEHDAHREMLRCRYRYYALWGLDIFDPVAFLWGHSAWFAPGLHGRVARVWQPLEDRLRGRLRLSAYHLGHDDLRSYLKRIAAFRPASLYGYSKALYLLALEAESAGFHCDALKLLTLTGEPASPYIVEKLQQVFGVPATAEYGATECGAIAAERPDRTLRVWEDVVFLETLPRADGRFEIVVTVLSNPSFPLLRYALADITDAPLELPPRGFAILKNVAGRNNDFIVARSGRYLHSARFDALFKYYSSVIRGFRVRQGADGSLAVQLEIDGPSAGLDATDLREKIRELVEGYAVTVDIVDRIPQTAAGKHRPVMSQLAPASFGGK